MSISILDIPINSNLLNGQEKVVLNKDSVTYTTDLVNIKNFITSSGGSGGANVSSVSGKWDSAYNTVNSLSTGWVKGVIDVVNLSGGWQDTYTTFSNNSSKYISNGTYPLNEDLVIGSNDNNTIDFIRNNTSLMRLVSAGNNDIRLRVGRVDTDPQSRLDIISDVTPQFCISNGETSKMEMVVDSMGSTTLSYSDSSPYHDVWTLLGTKLVANGDSNVLYNQSSSTIDSIVTRKEKAKLNAANINTLFENNRVVDYKNYAYPLILMNPLFPNHVTLTLYSITSPTTRGVHFGKLQNGDQYTNTGFNFGQKFIASGSFYCNDFNNCKVRYVIGHDTLQDIKLSDQDFTEKTGVCLEFFKTSTVSPIQDTTYPLSARLIGIKTSDMSTYIKSESPIVAIPTPSNYTFSGVFSFVIKNFGNGTYSAWIKYEHSRLTGNVGFVDISLTPTLTITNGPSGNANEITGPFNTSNGTCSLLFAGYSTYSNASPLLSTTYQSQLRPHNFNIQYIE